MSNNKHDAAYYFGGKEPEGEELKRYQDLLRQRGYYGEGRLPDSWYDPSPQENHPLHDVEFFDPPRKNQGQHIHRGKRTLPVPARYAAGIILVSVVLAFFAGCVTYNGGW